MTQVEFIQPTTLPSNNNAYTHVVRVGDWVFLAGQTAGGVDGNVVGPGDPVAQTKQVYARLAKAMESVGGSLTDIVETKTFWTDVGQWPEISAARAGMFGDKPPTGTRIAITSLARPEFLLEVEAIGYLGKENEVGGAMPAVEHLQPEGMSPNNNRYSHVVKIGPWVHIAGQTAGDADGNVVGVGDPAAQVEQVFANLTMAIESVGGKLSDIIKTTVYVVGKENSDAIRAARTGKFGDKPPTSTLLIIDGLARPEFMLEIEALAYVE